MPRRLPDEGLSPADRLREVATILARGLLRRRQQANTAACTDAQKSAPDAEICLELSGDTPLSGGRTRGLTLRDDGDDA